MKNLLYKIFDNSFSAGDLINKMYNGDNCFIMGMAGSSKAFLVAYTFLKCKTTNCIILPDKEIAAYFYDDITNIIGENNVVFLQSAYRRATEYQNTDNTNIVLKTEVINKLYYDKNPVVIVTYPEAIIEKIIKPSELEKNTLEISVGDNLSMNFVIEMLDEYGFEREDLVYEPGTYAVRGSIIDVFSFSNEEPYRIDFFGNEIESIRSFDANTQLSNNKLNKITIIPNIHNHISNEEKISFFEFINNDCKFWISQAELVIDKINNINPADFISQISKFQIIEFSHRSYFKIENEIKFRIEAQPAFNKQFELLTENIKHNYEQGYETFILSNNEKQLQRIKDIFEEIDNCGSLQFKTELNIINEGFIDHESKVCIYTDHQIFERYHRFKTKSVSRREGITFKELTALNPGDYVVHVDHGIGKFGGLQKINHNGKVQEVISIIYDENDILNINIHSLHRISKYRDKDGEIPKIHRLGSGHWKRLKERTKASIKDIARDLILLYAKRREQKGFAFSPDSYLQHELESSFIYEDTADQIKSNENIKADMESEIPMDRLICGDVGFGKTELAIRAAFKAVTDGKQVAVLVPTTILALQHFQTFSERLKNFPVSISYISRLKSAKDIKETVANVKLGKIDILIGTHKILNKDIEFKDLGLLIIDEEQKFGVSMKEKLRQLKVNIDTLTLTATPIPRTLQFSLMGARDLSVINTPPANRQPINTELHTFNNDIIKEAIYYEISRNGQVFFINNRIQNIYDIEKLINKICPEAKTVVAHGQMEGNMLEKIVLEFMRGDFDVLISTSIVENGVDIPNANTIIINNANNFGLSDLHQLRGRVGRSNRKAFCYLLAPPINVLTSEARRRLKAIEEFSELGSGINIALQDLDIRGAGNILGSEQSGFIADIGFETYNKILNEAIEELKESDFKDIFSNENHTNVISKSSVNDCQIETDFDISIPDYYISSTSERIKIYKELADIKSEMELEIYKNNLIDRFGKIPEETEKLFDIVTVRWTAEKLGFQKINIRNNIFSGYFPSNQESSYFSSDAFLSIINYIQNNPKNCILKEQSEKLTLKITGISSLEKLSYFLQGISSTLNQ